VLNFLRQSSNEHIRGLARGVRGISSESVSRSVSDSRGGASAGLGLPILETLLEVGLCDFLAPLSWLLSLRFLPACGEYCQRSRK
jgi:hypothetical protein